MSSVLAQGRILMLSSYRQRAPRLFDSKRELVAVRDSLLRLFSSTSSSSSSSSLLSDSPSFLSPQAIDQANQDSPFVEIRNTQDGRGWGLFARLDIAPDTLVFRSKPLEYKTQRESHTIQIGWNSHVIMDLPAILINHSCQANVGIQPNEFGVYDFFALRHIATHQELLWDYETCESTMASSKFDCSCGAPNCRGQLLGFDSPHGEVVLEAYGKDYIAPYLFTDKPNEN